MDALELVRLFKPGDPPNVQLAALSHSISRQKETNGGAFFVMSGKDLRQYLNTASLPSAEVQSNTFLQILGEHIRRIGTGYHGGRDLASRVGATSEERLQSIGDYLVRCGLITKSENKPMPANRENRSYYYPIYDLTHEGLIKFEEIRSTALTNRFGFVARKFDDPRMESFLAPVRKAVNLRTGIELREENTFKEPGLIDNRMRQHIKDCAFLVAELSRANNGAYWEAGYAEALGRPVIYLCEEQAFRDPTLKPHFDAAHSKIIEWRWDDPAALTDELVATIDAALKGS